MKKIVLVIVLITAFACKEEVKKTEEGTDTYTPTEIIEEVISEISIPLVDQWDLKGVSITETDLLFNNQKVYSISRIDEAKTFKYAIAAINSVKIAYEGGKYKISVIVKKGNLGGQLGIRIQGVYPIRTDVVFDLNNQNVKGIFKEEDLTYNEKTEMEDLGNGWFKCSFIAEIYTSYFRLVFGPTDESQQVRIWESLTDINSDLLIIPSSMKIEELAN
ncbi:MAG: hypothetical protein DRI75_09455 [Bacteroidetes bacterium]|nr:MAG: hypothetical protein DRI75_09455 [Bacteroidota bacterium]